MGGGDSGVSGSTAVGEHIACGCIALAAATLAYCVPASRWWLFAPVLCVYLSTKLLPRVALMMAPGSTAGRALPEWLRERLVWLCRHPAHRL